MKKHWYDYMWILSLTYLILGFFNIMFAWLGLLCFFIPLIIALVQGNKGYCNRYWAVRRPAGAFQEKGHSGMDEKQGVSIRLSGVLPHYVLPDAVEYGSGIYRSF